MCSSNYGGVNIVWYFIITPWKCIVWHELRKMFLVLFVCLKNVSIVLYKLWQKVSCVVAPLWKFQYCLIWTLTKSVYYCYVLTLWKCQNCFIWTLKLSNYYFLSLAYLWTCLKQVFYSLGLSINGIWSHLHVPTHASINLRYAIVAHAKLYVYDKLKKFYSFPYDTLFTCLAQVTKKLKLRESLWTDAWSLCLGFKSLNVHPYLSAF